jgi:hypothetical protein
VLPKPKKRTAYNREYYALHEARRREQRRSSKRQQHDRKELAAWYAQRKFVNDLLRFWP